MKNWNTIFNHQKKFSLDPISLNLLKGLFYPACLACVVSSFAFVATIFMAHENGDDQRQAKRRHVQGMLDETE